MPVAVKLGMLTSTANIHAITDFLSSIRQPVVTVLDPVMISTSGHTLLPDDAIEALTKLYGRVQWITPNIPEASRIAGSSKRVTSLREQVDLAQCVFRQTKVEHTVVKGGHLVVGRDEVMKERERGYRIQWEEGDDDEEDGVEVLEAYEASKGSKRTRELVVDVLCSEEGTDLFVGRKVESQSTHGTGCTLSSAIACCSALHCEDCRVF